MNLTIQQCLDLLKLDINYTCRQVDKASKNLIKAHPERKREFQTAAIRLKTNIDRNVAQNLLGLNNDFELEMIEKAFRASPRTEMYIRAQTLFHVELANMERGIASKLGLPEFTTDVELITKVFNERKEMMIYDPDAMKLFARYHKAMINRANYLLTKKGVAQENKVSEKCSETPNVLPTVMNESKPVKTKSEKSQHKKINRKEVKQNVEVIDSFISEYIVFEEGCQTSWKQIFNVFSINFTMESQLLQTFKLHFKKRLLKKFPTTIVKLQKGSPFYKNISFLKK